ncbi:ImmA/IrrE family metallo-endopeptidase, partial [Clostridium novyi]|uniref:ImmA/IrrE family metallo-endopeptidase n=1 Tax=Clostridium novyi TaxID=1542 RepID=UPI0004D5E893
EKQISLKEFIEKYGRCLKSEDVLTMLDGNFPYTPIMNKVATSFLGIKVKCDKNFKNLTYRCRLSEMKDSITSFIEEINTVFLKKIENYNVDIVEKYSLNINTLIDFMQNFRIKYPFDIETFIEENKINDNFILVKEPNNIGVSGFTQINIVKDVRYVCIYINTAEPLGRQNYTFCHELYHLYIEKFNYKLIKVDDALEKEAEKFASYILINRKELMMIIDDMGLSNYREIKFEQILTIQEKFNASFIAVLCAIIELQKEIEEHIREKKYPDEDIRIKNAIKKFPVIPKRYFKYIKNQYFTELEEKTLICRPDNRLNSPTNESNVD